jgi:hypothetical protein
LNADGIIPAQNCGDSPQTISDPRGFVGVVWQLAIFSEQALLSLEAVLSEQHGVLL